MSRRHRETEITTDSKPQQAEPQAGGRRGLSRFTYSASSLLNKILTVTKRDETKDHFSLDKIMSAFIKAFTKEEVEVDEEWVKIPRKYLEELPNPHDVYDTVEKLAPKRGRSRIKQIFQKISDSELVGYYHKAKAALIKTCAKLYESVTQYAVCFLQGSHQAFDPDDDPYGKMSHYHEILKSQEPELPTVRMLNNRMKWFVEFDPRQLGDGRKDRRERVKYRLWRQLMEWIRDFLKKEAPQYAFVCT